MALIEYSKVWSFKSKNIANNFDSHVRQSVPLYDEVQRMVVEIAEYFVREDDLIVDLGVSTGTTIKNIEDNIIRKNIKSVGIDESQEMLNVARGRLKDTELVLHDLNTGMPSISYSEDISLGILLFTLQFVKVERRELLLRQLYQSVRKGGAVILVEKILGNDAHFNEMMIDLYHDMKLRNGLKTTDNQVKTKSLRGIMSPITLSDNERLLRTAGFERVDIFFKWYNFVGFIATK